MGKEALALKEVNQEEIVGSKAFNLEYRRINKEIAYTDQEIREDLLAYLGEYRFGLSKYEYHLTFSKGASGFHLRDINRGEPMITKTERAILDKSKRGDSTVREEAELAGFKKLDRQLRFVPGGSTMIWVSPPGPRDQGYGDYGFVFFGKVQSSDFVKNIKMTAIRIEAPTINQFNQFTSSISEKETEFKTAEEFLANPSVLLRDISIDEIDDKLGIIFGFKEDKEIRNRFDSSTLRIKPLIEEFVRVMQNSLSSKDKKRVLNAIENMMIELRDRDDSSVIYVKERKVEELLDVYGKKQAPVVSGSCGSTQSANIMKNEVINSILEGEDEFGCLAFNCPHCGKKNVRPRGELVSHCQYCSGNVSCGESQE